jgi:hypothetical protein
VPRALGETPVDVEEQELPGVNPIIELPPRAVPGLIIGRTACLGHASMGWKGARISLNSKPAWAPLFCLSLELKTNYPLELKTKRPRIRGRSRSDGAVRRVD